MKKTLTLTIKILLFHCLHAQVEDTLKQHRDTILLEEVQVSTGLQRIPKERATGSFAHISEERFNQQVSTDIMSRLEAVASGYLLERPAMGSPRPLIRGVGTLLGPTAPLIILDNFPFEGNIDDINPHDVADITILKDAAAASIWGARAANGVIVIQTKKGQYQQPLHITLNSNTTIGRQPDLFYMRQMEAADFIEVEKMLYANGHYQSRINSSTFPALSPVVELLRKLEENEGAMATSIESEIERMKTHDVRRDYNTYFYRPAYNQQYALNVRGGTHRSAWAATAGFDNNRSNLGESYRRMNLRLQQQYRPVEALELRASILVNQINNQNGRPGYNGFPGNDVFPYASFADENGNPATMYPRYSQSFVEQVKNEGRLLRWDFYPLLDYLESSTKQERQSLVLDAGLEYTLPLGLTLDLHYQHMTEKGSTDRLQGSESFAARDLINSYTEIVDGEIIRRVPRGAVLDLTDNGLKAHQGRVQLNFNRDWGLHQTTALLGGEARHRQNTGRQHRLYGYDPHTLNFLSVDFTTPYPNYVTGNRTFVPSGLGMEDVTTHFLSLFANGSYTYNSKYTASFSARRDASNLFGLNTNDQWNLFWSAGLAWHLSQESFFRSDWLHYLKLRGTYGQSGNIDPAMVAITTMQYMGANQYTNTPYSQFSNYYNPDLRWETSRMLNMAVDFRLLGDRLSGSIEFYTKRGTDLFGQAIMDYTSGVGDYITKNTGSMQGTGWDIQLFSNNTKGVVRWQSQLNLTHYSDRVIENLPPSLTASNFLNGLNGTTGNFAMQGKPVNALYAYRWAGLDSETGDPLGYLDGEISKDYSRIAGYNMQVDDLVYIGPSVPQWFGALGNTFGYRNFSLHVNLLFKFGHFFRRHSVNYYNLYGANFSGAHADFSRRWQKPGDELQTDIPAIIYPAVLQRDNFYAGSEALVDRGDHIRLQYLRVSYDFEKVQIFGQATNLGILWKANKVGLDPEAVNKTSMPLPAQYALGVRAHFTKH